jgi:hypothetical protein
MGLCWIPNFLPDLAVVVFPFASPVAIEANELSKADILAFGYSTSGLQKYAIAFNGKILKKLLHFPIFISLWMQDCQQTRPIQQ